jgi:hypothetical protein
VSVQGLILGTPHPYFLEAGYDKQKGTPVGMHNSRIYNETVYLIAIQSIISNARNPPSPFEDVVKEHFRAKGGKIVAKCKMHTQAGTPTNARTTSNLNMSKNNNNENTTIINETTNTTNTPTNTTTNTATNMATNTTTNTAESEKTIDESMVFLEISSLGFKKSLGLLIPKLETVLQL